MFDFFSRKKSIAQEGILNGATDCHSHILFGVDDGIRTAEESLNVLKFLEGQGLKELWLTPHTMEDVPNTTEALKARFEELKGMYSGSIELHLASEYMMDDLFEKHLEEHDFLTHKEYNSVLVETSTWSAPYRFWQNLEEMMKEGYRPIIAHPERYTYMEKKDYERLHAMGARLQLNYPSLAGSYGRLVEEKARMILEKGWYDMTGSDCHRLSALHRQLDEKMLKSSTLSLLKEIATK